MPLVTPLYAGLAALMLVALSLRVIQGRWRFQVAIGDGGSDELVRRMRAQGNFIEYTPLALLLMLLAELQGYPSWLLHLLGIALLGGRAVHAWALTAASIRGRVIGMVLTFAVLTVGAVLCIAGVLLA